MKKIMMIVIVSAIYAISAVSEECNCESYGKPSDPRNECCNEHEYNPNWRRGGALQFSLNSGIINQVNNTLNKIPNVNIAINAAKLSTVSYRKNYCCGDRFLEDGIKASEGSVLLSANINNVPIYAAPSISKKYDLSDGDYFQVKFQAGAYLKSNFSMGGRMGQRWDSCNQSLNYLYGGFAASATIGVEGTAEANACLHCDFIDCDICFGDFSITPGALSIMVVANADVGNKDTYNILSGNAFSVSRLVYTASLKIYNYTFSYSYPIID